MSVSDDSSKTATVTRLEVAQPPGSARILAALDILRGEVERGEVISLVAITIRAGEAFDVTSAGEIRTATLAGILGRVHLDLLEAMRS